MLPLLALALLQAAAPAPTAADPDPSQDIVVVAVRPKKCNLAVNDKELSWGQVDNVSRQWGVGRPIRVLAPKSLPTKCLTKIMFKLADRGFRYVQFVDPVTIVPAPATVPGSGS